MQYNPLTIQLVCTSMSTVRSSSPTSSNGSATEKRRSPELRHFRVSQVSKQWAASRKKEDLKCSICLEPFEMDEFMIQLRCGHYYHINCSKQQAEGEFVNNVCGVCRQGYHPTITYTNLNKDMEEEDLGEIDQSIDNYALYLKAYARLTVGVDRKRKRVLLEQEEINKKLCKLSAELKKLNSRHYDEMYTVNKRPRIAQENIPAFELDQWDDIPTQEVEDEEMYVYNDSFDRQQREEYRPSRRVS